MAARAGQADVVRYLLKNGAKVETKSKVRTQSIIINHCVKEKTKRDTELGQKVTFLSLCRMTRQRCTYPVGWGRSTLSSSCCIAVRLPMLPPPQATPPFTWLPARDTMMLLPCSWTMVPPSHLQQRYVLWKIKH